MKQILRIFPDNFTLDHIFSQCFPHNKHREITRIIIKIIYLHSHIILRWLVAIIFDPRTKKAILPGKGKNNIFFTYINWKYYNDRKIFSFIIAHQTHTDITRKIFKQNIPYVYILTHYIGSFQFTVILAQQIHSDITRTRVLKYLYLNILKLLYWFIWIHRGCRSRNTYRYFKENR